MNSPTYRFIPEMFRRVMRGEKTQTRRVIVPVPAEGYEPTPGPCYTYSPTLIDRHGEMYPGPEVYGIATEDSGWIAPYGPPGTVKPCVTQWAVDREWNDTAPGIMDPAVVLAEHGVWFNDLDTPKPDWAGKTRPAMFFPKQFYPYAPHLVCRAVKAERVQDISPGDAIAEGVQAVCYKGRHESGGDWLGFVNYQFETAHPRNGVFIEDEKHRITAYASPINSFRTLWDSINDRRGYGWAVNPFVFATTFERQ